MHQLLKKTVSSFDLSFNGLKYKLRYKMSMYHLLILKTLNEHARLYFMLAASKITHQMYDFIIANLLFIWFFRKNKEFLSLKSTYFFLYFSLAFHSLSFNGGNLFCDIAENCSFLFFEESVVFLLIYNAFLINELFVIFITNILLLLFLPCFYTIFV